LRRRNCDCGFYELTTSAASAGLASRLTATPSTTPNDLNFDLAAC